MTDNLQCNVLSLFVYLSLSLCLSLTIPFIWLFKRNVHLECRRNYVLLYNIKNVYFRLHMRKGKGTGTPKMEFWGLCEHAFVCMRLSTCFCLHAFVCMRLSACFCVHAFVCMRLSACFCLHAFVCMLLSACFCLHALLLHPS